MKPNPVLAQVLESLRDDLDLLNLKVASMEASMKQQSLSVDTMVTTLKHIISNGYLDKPGQILSGDTT